MKPKTPAKLFGTDGIRGKAGEFPLNPVTVRAIGASLAEHLMERSDGRTPRIVIGRDTRESGGICGRDHDSGRGIPGALAAN